MAVGSILVLVLLLLVMVVRATYAVEHVVGGSAGWAPAVDYVKWAAGETFHVGDTLRFNSDAINGVIQVTLEDYNTCTSDHPIAAGPGGSTAFILTDHGPMFFICPVPGHCAGGGMKLAITVLAKNTTTTTTTPPTQPSAPVDTIYNDPCKGTIEATSFCGGSFVEGLNYLVIGVSLVLATVMGFTVL